MRRFFTTAILLLLSVPTWAGLIDITVDSDESQFVADTGAVSLTGPLPNIGAQGTSVTLADATLTAGNTIFVGEGWSSLLPNGRAIAISGPENLGITINTGLATAFGFWFHEPGSSSAALDGCNTVCVNSLFLVEFLLDSALVDSFAFAAANDVALFFGATLDEAFDSIKFTEIVGTNDNEFYGEMYVARVPEPGTLGLLALGMLGLVLSNRRRR